MCSYDMKFSATHGKTIKVISVCLVEELCLRVVPAEAQLAV